MFSFEKRKQDKEKRFFLFRPNTISSVITTELFLYIKSINLGGVLNIEIFEKKYICNAVTDNLPKFSKLPSSRLVPAVRLTAIPCHPKGIAILEENYFLRLMKLKTALAIVSGCGGQPGMKRSTLYLSRNERSSSSESANTPPEMAHDPSRIMILGSGTAS